MEAKPSKAQGGGGIGVKATEKTMEAKPCEMRNRGKRENKIGESIGTKYVVQSLAR